jgi:uncharacterized membrane protein
MRATATTLLLGVTTISIVALVIAGTVASLVTIGIHTWHQLLTVISGTVILDLVSSLVGIGVIISLIAGMFRYVHRRRDPSEPALE